MSQQAARGQMSIGMNILGFGAHAAAWRVGEVPPTSAYDVDYYRRIARISEERGTLDSAAIEREVTAVARRLVEENPDVRSILLECSDLPPYAHAVQAATGRPVFDFITMIDYVQRSVARRPYAGSM